MEKSKFNGYLQWFVIIMAVGSMIWYASSISSDVEYMKIDIKELKLNHKIELELLREEIKELRLEVKMLQQNKQ